MAKFAFDSNEHEPGSANVLIPEGEYTVIIADSEIKENKAQTGEYLQLYLEVVEGEHQGNTIFDRINVRHEKEKAEKIGLETLALVCMATGKETIDDTDELHDIPMKILVDVEPASGGYAASNRVQTYMPVSVDAQAPAKKAEPKKATPKKAAPKKESAGGSTPPWKK